MLLASGGIFCGTGIAQPPSDDRQERKTIERFLDVLLRRPRPGTSLDRVYGYHIQAGTLDDLLAELDRIDDESPGEPGGRQMLRGLLLLRRGNDAAAAEALARAESVRNDAAASYYLAKALLRIGRNEQAAEALERAILRNPPRSEALPMFTELGRLYQRGQQNEKALEVWNRLEETFPGDARVGEQIARTLADDGRHEAALERYEKLARQVGAADETRGITYRISAADMKLRLGRSDEALSELESLARQLRPGSWLHDEVRRRIESVFLRGGDYSALADYYADQVQSRPDDLALRRRLGRALAKAGRINEAEASLRETVERAPEDVDVRLALVDVLKGVGKAEQAAKQLERLTELDPENPDHLLQLGNTWLDAATVEQETRQEQAAAAWQRLAESRRDDPVASAQVADLMRRIERTDDAMGLYRRAIELAPDEPQYREYLGEYLHRLGRHEEAVQTWMAIAEPPRDQRDNLIRLAEVLHAFDEPDKGLDAFLKAAELDPTFAQRLRLSDLLTRSQRYDEALAQLDLAESSADTPEELEQLLQSRISVYQRSGTLESRIAEARETARQSNNAESYRRLALMLDAAGRSTEAGDAIAEALRVAADDRASLAAAGEIFRKAGRYGDAIQSYRSLAKLESRSLTHCLKQIAELQLQLGRIDEALVTAEELIQAQPANPDSYRFHAELCFRLGRDDEGIESLRRALRAAPRDRQSRRALASALAERFDTDEASEIYWGLLEDAGKLEEQEQWVSRLVPLYLRRGDFDQLINRLEQLGRDASDTRSATLLISATHRAAGDLGSARRTLEPLLAESPRDPELLSQMVMLAEAAGETEAALGYQEQLVAVADTPANRNVLIKLMIDAERIDRAEAALHRLRESGDSAEMVSLIDRVIDRGDPKTAIRFCRAALERNANLWEVRVRLAGMLVMTEQLAEAIREIERVESLGLPEDTLSEMSKVPSRSTPPQLSENTVPARLAASRFNEALRIMETAQIFQLGRYSSRAYQRTTPLPRAAAFSRKTYGQAVLLAKMLRLAIAAKQGNLEKTAATLIDWETLKATNDVERLWTAFYLNAAIGYYTSGSMLSPARTPDGDRQTAILWRLAEIDPAESAAVLTRILQIRQTERRPGPSGTSRQPPEPLTNMQMSLLRSVGERSDDRRFDLNDRMFVRLFHSELAASGREEEAEAFASAFDPTPDASEAAAALVFQIDLRRLDAVEKTLDVIAASIQVWNNFSQASQLSDSLTSLMTLDAANVELRMKALDLAIAVEATRHRGVTSRNNEGKITAYRRFNGRLDPMELAVPFSQRLASSTFLQQIYDGLQAGRPEEQEQLAEHLALDKTLLPESSTFVQSERKLRAIIDIFGRWVNGNPAAAYRRLTALSEEHPHDHDLWMERARLAAELKLPQEALEALDAIEPLDHATLRMRELAAMSLAVELGELERAKAAARRLLGMRLDTATELVLAEQLNRLGMRSDAATLLGRSHQRGGSSIAELVRMGEQMLEAGDNERAAEIAYDVLRRSHNDRSREMYRRQAVGLLQRAGGLERVLEQAERLAAAAPDSGNVQMQLADLYTAACRGSEAGEVVKRLAELQPHDPQTLWEHGKRLAEARRHGEALEKYVLAIAKNPDLLRQRFEDFRLATINSGQYAQAVEALNQIEVANLPPLVLSRLVSLAQHSGEVSQDAAARFLDRVFNETSFILLSEVLRDFGQDETLLGSDAATGLVRRIFKEQSVYEANTDFWRQTPGRGLGNPRGPLVVCILIIRARPDVEPDVRKQLAARRDDELTSGIARLIELALDQDVLEPGELELKTRELQSDRPEISAGLWWQFGQLFEQDADRRHVAVLAYEQAGNSWGSGTPHEYFFTVDAKLVDLYFAMKRPDKARTALRRAYASSARYQAGGPRAGYYVHRHLQSVRVIAERLEFAGGRLDAIRILAEVLSDPQQFERLAVTSTNPFTFEQFCKRLEDTVKRLVPSDFDRPLVLAVADGTTAAAEDAIEDQDDVIRLDAAALIPLPNLPAEHSSLAAIVVTELAKSQEGRARLQSVRAELDNALKQNPDDRALSAIRDLLAIGLADESASD